MSIIAPKSAYFTDLAMMLGLDVSRFKKDTLYATFEYSRPGLSNKRLRLWLLAALESQSNLIR